MDKDESYKELAVNLALTGATLIRDKAVKERRCDTGFEKQDSLGFIKECGKLSRKLREEEGKPNYKAEKILIETGAMPVLGVTETPEMMGYSNARQMLEQMMKLAEEWNRAENDMNRLIETYMDEYKIPDESLQDWYEAAARMICAGKDFQEKIRGIMERKKLKMPGKDGPGMD